MHVLAQGSGYPILFLHGIPTSSMLWSGVTERLSNQFHCIAVDLPGLGRTARLPHRFRNIPELAASLEDIRIQYKIDKWHVVAHDAGCAIAAHYVHQFHDHVDRLALLSPSMFPELKPFYLFEVLRRPIIGEMMAPVINLLFWKIAMRLAMSGNRSLAPIVSEFEAPFAGLRGSWRLMSLMRWGDPAELLASIPALLTEILTPTIVFHGWKDPAVPEDFARRACALLPNAELILLDSGHFLPMTLPAEVSSELVRFFTRDEHTELRVMVAKAHLGK